MKKFFYILLTILCIGGFFTLLLICTDYKNPVEQTLLWNGIGLAFVLYFGSPIVFASVSPLVKHVKNKRANKWVKVQFLFSKVFKIVLIIVYIGVVGYQSVKVTKIALDLDDFEEQRFEVVTGYIESPHWKLTKNGDVAHISSFRIADMKLKGGSTGIREDNYSEVKGRLITVTYLPMSKISVNWEYADKSEE